MVIGAAAAKGRLKGNWRERFGLVGSVPDVPGPRVWLHAVSVGEMQAAASLVRAMKAISPQLCLWVSTSTAAGRASAGDYLPEGTPVMTFPFDVYGGPARALRRLKPDLVVILETELWPGFLRAAKKRNAMVMLANGRISPRSIKGYTRVKPFLREVLGQFDLMAMIEPVDARRLISLGADPAKVRVVGSAKYDLLLSRADDSRVRDLKDRLDLGDRPVLIAGSTRTGEEPVVLDVFQRLKADFPGLHLILALRHIERTREVSATIAARGLTCNRLSRLKEVAQAPADITLVDTMGDLFFLYGLSTVAFCGGSLVNKGGQNPLEPAVWSVPMLYGPSMEDFISPKNMLEAAGAAETIRNGEELYSGIKALLADPTAAAARGRAGRRAVEGHGGAAERLAAMALDLLADR